MGLMASAGCGEEGRLCRCLHLAYRGLYQPGSVEFPSIPWEGMDTVVARVPSVCVSSWINIVEG